MLLPFPISCRNYIDHSIGAVASALMAVFVVLQPAGVHEGLAHRRAGGAPGTLPPTLLQVTTTLLLYILVIAFLFVIFYNLNSQHFYFVTICCICDSVFCFN